MMNYSKNMKRLFNRYKLYILMFLMAFALIAIVTACHGGSKATDEPKETEIVSQLVTTAETTASPATLPEVTVAPIPEPEYVSLGEFKLTAYCGCSICCGKWGENRPVDSEGKTIVMTAGGYRAVEGKTVAADISVLPYGTAIYIDGHEYTVQDRGGAINGNKIDIYFDNHQDAVNFGVQYKEIFVLKGSEPND